MTAVPPALEIPRATPVPRLLVELPSRPHVFFGNLRDFVFPRRLPPLQLHSSPAPFWHDVFVNRPLPWNRFLQSGGLHVIAGMFLLGFTHILALQPRVVSAPVFEHSQVVYYRASEYLPPIDTRTASAEPAPRTDPEFSRQAIISVPREADNRSQTLVTPPNVKLKTNVPMPNVVRWSDAPVKPRLAIPDAPLSPAAEITRLAPTLENQVAAPPQDALHPARRRNLPGLQDPVAAPPQDLRATAPTPTQGLQPALIAPPSDLDISPSRRVGSMNIAPSQVVAPAPQLAVADQRATGAGRRTTLGGPQVVAPPPSLGASGSSGNASGSPGLIIALNLHPAVEAPPDPPAGNRRGAFATGPLGRVGASGTPGSSSGSPGSGTSTGGGTTGKGTGGTATSNAHGDAPAGLHVGSQPNPSSVAGNTVATANAVSPPLVASVRAPRVTTARPMQPDNAAKLSEPERAVFGNRRFYSVTLNMPNLNSAGGSWVIRFAELKHDPSGRESNAPPDDLSQPTATRKVDPAYPTQLMRENVHGTVILYAVIHADGTVGSVRVLRGIDDRLDRYATEAIQKWQFEPATKNGTPVDVEATFQIPFRPARVGTNF